MGGLSAWGKCSSGNYGESIVINDDWFVTKRFLVALNRNVRTFSWSLVWILEGNYCIIIFDIQSYKFLIWWKFVSFAAGVYSVLLLFWLMLDVPDWTLFILLLCCLWFHYVYDFWLAECFCAVKVFVFITWHMWYPWI